MNNVLNKIAKEEIARNTIDTCHIDKKHEIQLMKDYRVVPRKIHRKNPLKLFVPSDILVTLPVKDITIDIDFTCDETRIKELFHEEYNFRNKNMQDYRIIIFKKKKYTKLLPNNCIGIIISKLKTEQDGLYMLYAAPLVLTNNCRYIDIDIDSGFIIHDIDSNGEIHYCIENDTKNGFCETPIYTTALYKYTDEEFYHEFLYALGLWYGLQKSLLKPVTIRNSSREKRIVHIRKPEDRPIPKKPDTSKNKDSNRTKIKYYKRETNLEYTYVYNEGVTKNEYRRHCKKWYVTGHFRHYKDGKIIFIDGYWKGPERNDEYLAVNARKRELVLDHSDINFRA